MSDTLTSGDKLGAYVLIEQLGTGGLGEVWKARDTRLNRMVALKFLARERAAPQVDELLREARAASALNHPNIVTIFEVGETASARYLAMEFVPGETLRQRMKRGAAPIEEALDISSQVAEGLSAAHREGIVHRDLKPENIMIRVDGLVKLLDFGLAKVLPWAQTSEASAAATASATTTGQIVGTLTYMSPEQARGQPVTPASDVFAFGIILFELLAGEHPFRAATTLDTLTAILTREPEPVSSRRAEVPPAVEQVVSRSLEKEPSRRFASIEEVSKQLRQARMASVPGAAPAAARHKPRWMQAVGAILLALLLTAALWGLRPWLLGGKSQQAIRAVAVMPLKTEASEAQAATAARALPEDLGAALSRTGFQVASYQSAQMLSEMGNSRAAGRQLGVDAVLEGTVRQLGNRLRLHLELIDARTGFQAWSGTYALEPGDDVLNGERASQIAGDIRATLDKK